MGGRVPAWDYRTLRFDTADEAADRAAADVLNVTDPNLAPFFARGGKFLLYHGWNDQLVAPLNSVNDYSSIATTVGPAAADGGVRLFMLPGINHCGGGDGPTTFDRMRSALSRRLPGTRAPGASTTPPTSFVANPAVRRSSA